MEVTRWRRDLSHGGTVKLTVHYSPVLADLRAA